MAPRWGTSASRCASASVPVPVPVPVPVLVLVLVAFRMLPSRRAHPFHRDKKEDTVADSFGDRVAAAVAGTGPLCAGIDPSSDLLAAWGLRDDATGLRSFCAICVEAFAGAVSVVKPQVAFFERHGAAGLAELERLIAEAVAAGLIVIADAKRGDIDSTAAAYADAWLGDASPLAADAVTVHPYLGLGALAPLVHLASANGKGVMVVVRSSNPEGRDLQQAVTAGGAAVEDMLLAEIAALNRAPEVLSGTVGAVVGATMEPSAFALSQLGGVILAPGLGAQGARPADVAARFAGCRPGTVLPSSSRGLLNQGPDAAALRDSARSLNRELAAAMG
jgi:orotidine-5'-phosphate decarboxylase